MPHSDYKAALATVLLTPSVGLLDDGSQVHRFRAELRLINTDHVPEQMLEHIRIDILSESTFFFWLKNFQIIHLLLWMPTHNYFAELWKCFLQAQQCKNSYNHNQRYFLIPMTNTDGAEGLCNTGLCSRFSVSASLLGCSWALTAFLKGSSCLSLSTLGHVARALCTADMLTWFNGSTFFFPPSLGQTR